MTVVFFGNTKYSTFTQASLFEHNLLSTVVTIPDRPNKRGVLTANPVKEFAMEHQIPVIETNQLNNEIIEKVKQLHPDFLIVVDYGLILPNELLTIAKIASLNIHHSLLPKYRGPSPGPTAILNGEKTSGVSIIEMSDSVDAGDIVAWEKYELQPSETTDSLLTNLNKIGSDLIIGVIEKFKSQTIQKIKQDESLASFTKRITKLDGQIFLKQLPDKTTLDRMIRAYFPWPNVWFKTTFPDGKERVVKLLPNKQIQVEGKNSMSFKDFLNGYEQMKDIIEKLSF